MNFGLTEQQAAIQETARNFAQTELQPGVLERDANSEFPVDLYKKMGELGLIGLPYPKEVGGQGADYLSYALAVEEISKVDASVGISYSVSTSLYGGSIMNSDAPVEKKNEFLAPVLSGQHFGSFGLTEPNAGSDAGGCVTVAEKDGDEYILNGMKCFNTNGPLADYTAVYALTEPEKKAKGLSCFVVKKGTPGFSVGKVEDKMGIRVAAQGLGIAEGAFEIAKEYLKTREQFGKPLYRNQYLAFKMAELEMEIDAAKLMLYKAATDKQEGRPYSIPAAKAKYLCTEAAMHVTTEAVQMLGGNGYMKGYHVERMMRDAKITQIYEGTNEIQKLVVSGAIFR